MDLTSGLECIYRIETNLQALFQGPTKQQHNAQHIRYSPNANWELSDWEFAKVSSQLLSIKGLLALLKLPWESENLLIILGQRQHRLNTRDSSENETATASPPRSKKVRSLISCQSNLPLSSAKSSRLFRFTDAKTREILYFGIGWKGKEKIQKLLQVVNFA